ncbi:hypothetical protein [Methanocrinis sp.]|uniref:hypothetical protein n=1 Tax=Methanocrinis sp. TaxID=3101522 RepID=UPI003D0C889B
MADDDGEEVADVGYAAVSRADRAGEPGGAEASPDKINTRQDSIGRTMMVFVY